MSSSTPSTGSGDGTYPSRSDDLVDAPTLPDQHTRDKQPRKPRHGDAATALLLAHSRHAEAPPDLLDFHQRDDRRGRGGRGRGRAGAYGL